MRDPEFWSLPKYEKNMLLWTALFHDICKRGKPLFDSKDPAHPFNSAKETISILGREFKFFEMTTEQAD